MNLIDSHRFTHVEARTTATVTLPSLLRKTLLAGMQLLISGRVDTEPLAEPKTTLALTQDDDRRRRFYWFSSG